MKILLIDIDSQRPDNLGCYGYHRDTSPNIDRVAARGVRFDRAYVSNSPCVPGRASLFGGQFGVHNGVATHWGPGSEYRIDGDIWKEMRGENVPFMAKQFFRQDYLTVSVSSFADRHAAFWFTSGWHEFHSYTEKHGNETADEVNAEALPTLRRICQNEDWLMHVNYWDPHRNYRVPEEWLRKFDGEAPPDWPDQTAIDSQQDKAGPFTAPQMFLRKPDLPIEFPDHIRTVADFERWINGYDGSIAFADYHFGQLLDVLEEKGVLEETCIVITADHGEHQGEQGVYGDHVSGYEATHHIPLIISWPGRLQEGVSSDEFVYSLDIAPTLCDLAGIEAAEGWDGRSLGPVLRGEGEDYDSRDHLVFEHALYCCQRSVRTRKWLFTRTYHPGLYDFAPVSLFDMEADPYQTQNVLAEHPDVVAEMDHLLSDWLHQQLGRPGNAGDPMMEVIRTGPWKYAPKDRWLDLLREGGRDDAADAIEARLEAWPNPPE